MTQSIAENTDNQAQQPANAQEIEAVSDGNVVVETNDGQLAADGETDALTTDQPLGSASDSEVATGSTLAANDGAVQTASTAEAATETAIQAEEVGIDAGSAAWVGGAGLALVAGLLAAGGSGGSGHTTETATVATSSDNSTATNIATVSTPDTGTANTATVSTPDTGAADTAAVSPVSTDSVATSTENSTATDVSTSPADNTAASTDTATSAAETTPTTGDTSATVPADTASSDDEDSAAATTGSTVAGAASTATDTNTADANNTAIASASDLGSSSAASGSTTATVESATGNDTAVESSTTNPNNAADTSTVTSSDATANSTTETAATNSGTTAASGTTEAADSTDSSADTTDSATEPVADTTSADSTSESSTVADSTTTEAVSSANSSSGTSGGSTSAGAGTSATADSAKEAGLTLDIAKHFYSVDAIKDYIDTLSEASGTFLQLHLSDDTNYALESKVLNQLTENAVLNSDGSYTNPLTGQQFLSTDQVSELAAYAKQKGIELVPEVDTPSHMDGIFTLLEAAQGSAFVSSIKSSVVNDEINITSSTAISWVKSLLGEVVGMFGSSSQHLHIGGDEFGYSVSNNNEFVSYVNTLSSYLAEQGITARVWNDGLLKSNLAGLDHSVQVTYWSYDGNPTDSSVADDRREIRASMGDLLDDGFQVLNYNWYYLYSVPEQGVSSEDSGAHMASDIQTKWNLGMWDGTDTTTQISDTSNIIGSSLTIWGENADGLTEDEILNWNSHAISALVSKTNAGSIDISSLPLSTVTLSADTVVNQKVSFTDQSGDHIQVSASQDFLASGNAFVWLDGDVGDVLSLDSGWVASGASAVQDGNSYTLYRNGLNHVYVDTDINVQIAVV